MALQLPPTPVGVPPGHSFWNDWYEKLRTLINEAQVVSKWINLDFTSSNITDIINRNHNNLSSFQGGTAGEYFHLTSAEHTALTGSVSGTFTPTLIGTTAAGVGTYTTQSGKYTRIGNVVHIHIDLNWTAHTGTGNMRISGLPVASTTASALSIVASNLTFTNQLIAFVNSGNTTIDIRTMSTGATTAALAMDTSAGLTLTGIYFA